MHCNHVTNRIKRKCNEFLSIVISNQLLCTQRWAAWDVLGIELQQYRPVVMELLSGVCHIRFTRAAVSSSLIQADAVTREALESSELMTFRIILNLALAGAKLMAL